MGNTYGVIGMLERIRDPSKAGVAPPPRDAFWDGDILDPAFWVELLVLLLTRRRRNCSLFIFGILLGRSCYRGR